MERGFFYLMQQFVDGIQEIGRVKRFFEYLKRKTLFRNVVGEESAHENNPEIGAFLQELFGKLLATHVWHDDIREQKFDVPAVFFPELNSLGGAGCEQNLEVFGAKIKREKFPHSWFIIDNKNEVFPVTRPGVKRLRRTHYLGQSAPFA